MAWDTAACLSHYAHHTTIFSNSRVISRFTKADRCSAWNSNTWGNVERLLTKRIDLCRDFVSSS